MIENGVNVNGIVGDIITGQMPWPKNAFIDNSNIHKAIELENVEIVKILVSAKADLTVKSRFNSQPLHTGILEIYYSRLPLIQNLNIS